MLSIQRLTTFTGVLALLVALVLAAKAQPVRHVTAVDDEPVDVASVVDEERVSSVITVAEPATEVEDQAPSITIAPDQVSCTTKVTVQGESFTPGSQVIVSSGGVEDIPGSVFEAYWGPAPVADDGTFAIDGVEPRINECIGLPSEPHLLTASTVTGESVGGAFGPPTATASFTFVADPGDPNLTLTPDHGSGCFEVTARGENFEPNTYVSITVGQYGGHVFGSAVDEDPLVGDDGTFTVTLSPELTPFIDCEGEVSQVDGSLYRVSASTGQGPRTGDPYRDPSAAHVFTVTLPPAERFEQTWARTDEPVASGAVDRTWMWGPEPFTEVREELYINSPGDMRTVQYFDKSRMEINNPDADRTSPWYVTNGLLVVEMVEGKVQTGDDWYEESYEPAEIPIAGDPGSTSPRYAEINQLGLMDKPARDVGAVIDEYIYTDQPDVRSDAAYAAYGLTAARYVPETDHTVASVFWDFMNSEGLIAIPGQPQYYEQDLFPNPFYATGYPITEAYWTTTLVDGQATDVLWQCFERRCLTYTPANPEGWKVEAGNVGRHYYEWRYPGQ